MKPTEFSDLQAKIRAQESQLHECETALKLRTEELKLNKAERDDFAGKYERYVRDPHPYYNVLGTYLSLFLFSLLGTKAC